MNLINIKENDPQKNIVEHIITTLLQCSDGKYITEIFVKDGSYRKGFFGNWVAFMVELDPEFSNESLYDTINNLDDELESLDTTFVISTEIDTIDRSVGTILYKRGEV